MAENKQQDPVRFDPDLTNPANRHERSDVNYRAVTKFGVALALLCILSFALIIGVFRFLRSQQEAGQPKPAIPADARQLPPEPRLQSVPVIDLNSMRAAEDQILNGYAWVDSEKGLVRIPVKQAMDLLAQRGLPSRPTAAPLAPASVMTVPTESSLGPKLQQPGGPLASELNASAPVQPPQPAHPAGNSPSQGNRPLEQPSLPAGQEKKH
jgi:hypothetical protein